MENAERIYRYIEIDSAKIDRAAKTVPLTFSSEFPSIQKSRDSAVHRSAGLKAGELFVEILDHSPESVDLSVLNNRGALLDEHDDKDQIGVIEKSELLTTEKRTAAIAKLDSHDKATTRFEQMASGSRPHVSAGYVHTRFLGDETLPNGRKAKRFAWRALEVSSVAIPADPTVGVVRAYADLPDLPKIDSTQKAESKTQQSKSMTPEELAAKEQADRAQRAAITSETLGKDRERRTKIHATATALAEQYKSTPDAEKTFRKLAEKADLEGTSVEDFNALMLAELPNVRKLEKTAANIGMSDKDVRNYSFLRAIRSCIENKGQISNDCPEFDLHQQAEKTYNKRASGFWIPTDVVVGSSDNHKMQRDLQAGVFGQGGAFVPTVLSATPIEILRNKMVLQSAGIQVMGGLTGNPAIPRQTGAATAYNVSEIAQLTTATQVLDQITMTPKRVGATTPYSKQLLIQSSVDVENFVRNDLMAVVALNWDYLGLNGSGAGSQPTGIVNIAGVGSVNFGAAATYAKLVSFETALNAANSRDGKRSYITSPTAKGTLKSAAKALVGGGTNVTNVALWENDEINGYSAYDTNQVLNNQMLFGNWSDLILGLFGGFDVVVDPFTLAKNAEVVITVNTFGDYVCRHPQSFCISSDSAAQ